jgi:hypothetical protein
MNSISDQLYNNFNLLVDTKGVHLYTRNIFGMEMHIETKHIGNFCTITDTDDTTNSIIGVLYEILL